MTRASGGAATSMAASSGPSPAGVDEQGEAPTPPLAPGDKERSIVRQSCLKVAAALMAGRGVAGVPVVAAGDRVVGVIHTKEILDCLDSPEEFSLRRLARPPLFVPEAKPIADEPFLSNPFFDQVISHF